MKKLLLCLSVLALGACTPTLSDLATAPAPLERTSIDEQGLIVAVDTFETLLTVVDQLVAANIIVPGSPRALSLQGHLRTAQAGLNAAAAAQKAVSTTDYLTALAQVRAALVQARIALKLG